ncbi:MAG TPA: PTS sugar transporter subunit IIA [Pyrinomonadaceae bacterium]|nr:PTS sugar transporter subunit IIA [Pyrinomonadaceae bacterium]
MDEIKRIGAVIVSHGQVANELLAAAEAVVGEVDNVAAVSIGWHDDVEAAKAEIERAIERVSQGAGVLLLTDMFGGTPTNISAMFLRENEVEIVSGVNLPMVVKVATIGKAIALADFAKEIEEQGKSAIMRAGDLLEPLKLKKDA